MKYIAYFLPQFHEVEENNKWWGEGFTEWSNVKNSKPLFKNHNQPKEPFIYYDLLDKEVVKWQTDISQENNIYGFCYYHYWFSGKKILEKPAENLLEWNDINQKFMFCWANHSWKKTWNGTNELLIKQDYGPIDEWEEHIEYLLTFFKDQRYIKIDNKPVFMLYSSVDIPNLDERIKFYNQKCLNAGLSGIYVIESLNSIKSKKNSIESSALVIREPTVSLSNQSKFKKVQRYATSRLQKNYFYKVTKFSYSKIVSKSLAIAKEYKKNENEKVFLGAFTDWDSTPRHGRRGYIISGRKKNDLKKYLLSLESLSDNNDFIFINAWNEWSEGMFLEPEKKERDSLLKEIKELKDEKKV